MEDQRKGFSYRHILGYIQLILNTRERRRFRLLTALHILVSILDIAAIAFLFVVIHFYAPQTGVTSRTLLAPLPFEAGSLMPALLLLAFYAAKSAGGYYVYKLQYEFVNTVACRLSQTGLMQHMAGSYESHVNNDAAASVRKILYQPIEFAQYVLAGVQLVIMETALVTIAVIALLLYNAKLLLIVALTLLPAIALISLITRKRLTGIRRNIKQVNQESLQYLNEAVAGYVESNLHGRNDFFIARYTHAQNKLGSYLASLQITQGIPSRFFEAFAILGLFILIAAIRVTTGSHTTDIIALGAFVAAAYKIIPGISRIINLGAQIKTYSYTLTELLPPAAARRPSMYHPEPEALNSLAFDKLSFSYNNRAIFNDLSFQISSGTFTGISGDSGIGKTTLLHLLLGFLQPAGGEILFNNKTTPHLQQYWNNIAYVKQQPFLLHDTILNNITLYDADCDQARLNQVLDVTGLHHVVSSFPDKLHTMLAEAGRNISGGQRQRIAIARALYKNADLILLDEPFNELDQASETRLLQHFQLLAAQGKMVLLITHNKQSLQFCHSIIQLNEQ
ncbi:ATP-binding cassette domain-containing protein [Deminuibacter soli]|uniref:ABC transporter ATP-binding protein n=1 Tax=Deminuibacter soli TaxID=2291815 RepID=A0A3E1NK03_9BACT|nr:ABC transporter ATP-binding protein [Deminuibacter soli]RFM28265.1 ABC transporter ATP-binding protein [Deminuibacter soli]